ncbi:phosphotransferase family protein [Mycobacterium paragordonae]|uniref:Aminoglycoside phosphotransferase n=1 Tax=Mycobacterium paragordonae TaxID=1389713 RepID=A0AAJ1SI48_9MYCO|nr:phosphotransferase family protein [Mycobacterium paragordonae]AYE97731.1 phosphotransferase family protein [Mycobacterium paragordonae]MDP7738608.1 phosphotransferase family protein [Mycobacterium paragordonae]GFG81452.1 aminoglycoside phosphotransferase [Mycobacterium paragordonae]
MAELSIAELGGRLDIEGLHPLTGGASSLTYAGRLAGEQVVVKVAPAGVEPIGHRDVLRQCRIIKALAPTPVPVPRVLLEDPGDPPEVPPLFVMSRVDGDSPEPLFDLGAADQPETLLANRFRDAAETMARLHRMEPAAVGLAAEPVIGPEAEIDRWCRTLETVDPALAPGWPDVRDALRAALPAPLRPRLVHGDFRLGNLLAVGDRITAVIDWEIWSVGDPRVDVGWFLINSDPQTYRRATRDVGVTPAELAAVYQSALGYSVPDLDWFQALACFKSVATWALIVKHNRRRPRPDAELEAMSKTLPHLLSRAQAYL